jgi:hypothetical protein
MPCLPLGPHDRHSFGGVLCVKEMPLAASSTLVCGSESAAVDRGTSHLQHPSITGTRRAGMSLLIENDGVAETPPLVFLRCRAATEFEP